MREISGEAHPGVGDELHLTEDLHLDSLGRVQLAAAIEDRLGFVAEDGMLDGVQTLGELRRLVAGEENGHRSWRADAPRREGRAVCDCAGVFGAGRCGGRRQPSAAEEWPAAELREGPLYLSALAVARSPVQWMRAAFIEAVMRPLVWLLAQPARGWRRAALKLGRADADYRQPCDRI